LPCLDKYVASTECGGFGSICVSDADCNHCSLSNADCLTENDCDYGICDDGRDCSVARQDCIDASTCVVNETCVVSGELCEAAPVRTIDVNSDGLIDGIQATLTDDPAKALVMPLADWTSGIKRCSKSGDVCVIDGDCTRGVCSDGEFCNVFAQDCFDASTCVLDEACLPGKVFVTSTDIVPDTQYDVSAECGTFLSPPGSGTTCLWADLTCNGVVTVTDLQLLLRGFQGVFEFSTLVELDIHPCHPQRILNVGDVQSVLLAIQGKTYYEMGCPVPCP